MQNKMNHAGPVSMDCTSMATAGCSSAPNSSAYAIDNTQLGKKKMLQGLRIITNSLNVLNVFLYSCSPTSANSAFIVPFFLHQSFR